MSLEIHLQNYKKLPNLEELRNAQHSECSYFSLGFQLSFQTEDKDSKNQQDNLIFLVILLVDQHEKKLSVLYEKSDYIIQTNNTYQNNFSTNEVQFKDTDGFQDKIQLTAIDTNTNIYDHKNLGQALNAYLHNDITPNINVIKKYLQDNDINYYPNEFDSFFNKVRNKMNESFCEDYLKNFMAKEINNANSLLMYNNLNQKIPVKNNQISNKLKI